MLLPAFSPLRDLRLLLELRMQELCTKHAEQVRGAPLAHALPLSRGGAADAAAACVFLTARSRSPQSSKSPLAVRGCGRAQVRAGGLAAATSEVRPDEGYRLDAIKGDFRLYFGYDFDVAKLGAALDGLEPFCDPHTSACLVHSSGLQAPA